MPIQQGIAGHLHPVKVWASQIEEQALRQLGNGADLPIIYHHVVAMPDAHCGIGATVGSVPWAQGYAAADREEMLKLALSALARHLPGFVVTDEVVNCHHNCVAREHHFDADVWVTRKGAIRAGRGDLGIVPGSMGTRSYIVCGLGNAESFESSARGAGQRMSRTQARHEFSEADMVAQTGA